MGWLVRTDHQHQTVSIHRYPTATFKRGRAAELGREVAERYGYEFQEPEEADEDEGTGR